MAICGGCWWMVVALITIHQWWWCALLTICGGCWWKSSHQTGKRPWPDRTMTNKNCKLLGPTKTVTAVQSTVLYVFQIFKTMQKPVFRALRNLEYIYLLFFWWEPNNNMKFENACINKQTISFSITTTPPSPQPPPIHHHCCHHPPPPTIIIQPLPTTPTITPRHQPNEWTAMTDGNDMACLACHPDSDDDLHRHCLHYWRWVMWLLSPSPFFHTKSRCMSLQRCGCNQQPPPPCLTTQPPLHTLMMTTTWPCHVTSWRDERQASTHKWQPAPSNNSQHPQMHTGNADRRQGMTMTMIIIIIILTSSTHHVTRFQWEVSACCFNSMNTIRSYLCSLLPSHVH